MKRYVNFIYLLSTDLIIKGLNLILVIYFARKLVINDFGLLSLLITYFTYFLVLIEFGTSHLALKEIINLSESERAKFITNVIIFKLILSFVSIVVFNILFFNELKASTLFLFSVLLILSSFLNDWYFKSLYKNKLLFIAYLLGLVGYFYLLFISDVVINDFFVIKILLAMITVLLMFYFLVIDGNLKLEAFSISYIKKHLINKSFPLFISTVAVVIYYNSDVIMLNYYKTSFDVGIYSAYYKFVFVFLTLKGVIIGYITPKLSYLYANRYYVELLSFVKKNSRYISIGITLLVILVYTFYEMVVYCTFGEKYLVDGSNELLFVLLFTVVIVYNYLLLPTIQIVIDKQKVFMSYVLIAAVINILCNVYLIPLYGFIGAAYSTLISELILFFLFFVSYKKFKRSIM